MRYEKTNTFGTNTESWIQVSGTGSFSKDAKGQQVFTTKTQSGVYKA
ncbi:MAG: hypothetical protein ABIQ31_20420 [Ferruginibacter sp.]